MNTKVLKNYIVPLVLLILYRIAFERGGYYMFYHVKLKAVYITVVLSISIIAVFLVISYFFCTDSKSIQLISRRK